MSHLLNIYIFMLVKCLDNTDWNSKDLSKSLKHFVLFFMKNSIYRDLIYQVHVDQFIEECYVAIYLQLPSALYANVNELTNLRRLGIVSW